jgi:hypothetical protein
MQTCSELERDVPGFVTHFEKQRSLAFWMSETLIIYSPTFHDKELPHTFISSCALASAISCRTEFIIASFLATISTNTHRHMKNGTKNTTNEAYHWAT